MDYMSKEIKMYNSTSLTQSNGDKETTLDPALLKSCRIQDLFSALVEKCVEKGRQKGIEECQPQIAMLENERDKYKQLYESEQKSNLTATQTGSSRIFYNFDHADFEIENPSVIIEVLIVLAQTKNKDDKYKIQNKTDWFIVWKVLLYSKVYFGSCYDFIDLVNVCVIENIDEKGRRDKLRVTKTNIDSIRPDSPIREFTVDCWRRKYKEQVIDLAGSSKSPFHGTLILKRALDIMLTMKDLFREYGIPLGNLQALK